MNKKALIFIFVLFYLSLSVFAQDEQKEIVQQATNLYNEAIDLYKQDDVERAIKNFTKVLELKPDFYEAHYNLSQILMSLNKNDEALKSLEEIQKIKPGDTENLYNIGKTYYKSGYLSKAYEYLKKIDVNALQYDEAKLILSKIEKRQDELNLENKINSKKSVIDIQGIASGIELVEFSAPSGVVVDGHGNIYVASFLENVIYKITIHGQKTIFSKSNLIQGPIGLAIDRNENIYVANYSVNNIVKITPNSIASVFAQISKPYCLNYDSTNNRLYVTEQGANKLIKFDL